MIGLILIYFLAKPFYQLAEEHKKNKWVFAILAIITYYAGAFVGGLVLGLILELSGVSIFDNFSDIQLGLIALPFGLLSCFGLYKFLEKKWKKTAFENLEILDDELLK